MLEKRWTIYISSKLNLLINGELLLDNVFIFNSRFILLIRILTMIKYLLVISFICFSVIVLYYFNTINSIIDISSLWWKILLALFNILLIIELKKSTLLDKGRIQFVSNKQISLKESIIIETTNNDAIIQTHQGSRVYIHYKDQNLLIKSLAAVWTLLKMLLFPYIEPFVIFAFIPSPTPQNHLTGFIIHLLHQIGLICSIAIIFRTFFSYRLDLVISNILVKLSKCAYEE